MGGLPVDDGVACGTVRDRSRIIVLNKADIPDAAELAEFVKEDLEQKFGWPVFIVSAVARKGLEPLKYKLLEIVQEARKKRPKEKAVTRMVVRPKAVDAARGKNGKHRDFTIEPDPENTGGFIVHGEKPARWIMQTDFENDEAVGYLADRLNRLGVEDVLLKAGAEAGCPVTIGGITFEWEPMTSAGTAPVLTGRGTDIRLSHTKWASAAERKRASQARRGLIDELDFGDGQEADRKRWEG